MKSWYLIRSKPHQEQVAASHLQRLEVETFCPRLKRTKILRKKKCTVVESLFPGYLFAMFSLGCEYRKVVFAHGVADVVRFGAAPAIVDDETIISLQARTQEGYVHLTPASFQVGQVVRISGGAFTGLQAVFEKELTGTQRVALLLKSVALNAHVIIDRDHVANW